MPREHIWSCVSKKSLFRDFLWGWASIKCSPAITGASIFILLPPKERENILLSFSGTLIAISLPWTE